MQLLYVTCKSQKEAEKIANALLKERLAACCNIAPKVVSLYREKGKVKRVNEALLFTKTKDHLVEESIRRIKELHSYKVPCIVTVEIKKGNADYVGWTNKEVK